MADDEATARRTTKAAAAGSGRKRATKKANRTAAPVGKAAVKKSAVTKAAVSKAPAKKASAQKASVKKASVRKSPARTSAGAPASEAAPRKTTGRKTPAKQAGARAGAVLAPRKKAPPPLRLAAEQTFDADPWQAPEPEPVRDDPSARVRGLLRAAALSLEAKEAGAPPAAPTRPAPAPEEAVTRVLVSPPPEPDLEVDDTIEQEVVDDEVVEDDLAEPEVVEDLEPEEDDWSPPEILDDGGLSDSSPPPPPPPSEAPSAVTTEIIVPPAPAPAPAPEKKKGRRGLRLLLVVVALAVVAGAVLLVLALRDEGIDYSKLKVGDCFDSSQSDEVRVIDVKPGSEPHDSEIFFLVQHPAGADDPYPGKDALVQFAADACLGQPLTEYLGGPLEQSRLKDFEIVPQESAWNDGRRVLVCGVDTGGGEDITGSVRGTRR